MSQTVQCRMKPYIQPFERQLATAELMALSRHCVAIARGNTGGEFDRYSAIVDSPPEKLARCLAYYESVRQRGQEILTSQVLKEATVYVARNGVPIEEIRRQIPIKNVEALPNRRCLRYGTHGVHEYRGKFFPQLVLSLINIAKVPAGGLIADPMCGSGTTLVEASLAGCRGIGLDMNPLSVFMSQIKCQLLSVNPDDLVAEYHRVRAELLNPTPATSSNSLAYFERLPARDQEYLKAWFSAQVLEDLDTVSVQIETVNDVTVRDFMRLALSNILRSVSWQKEEDLRVRKEVRTDVEIDPIREFLEELGRSVRLVAAFLYQHGQTRLRAQSITEGDASRVGEIWHKWLGTVDAVITSPPYATALPYLDTDRLSLSYLGLLPRQEHRDRDKRMIGNREITEKTRQEYMVVLKRQCKLLPKSAIMLIGKIDLLNEKSDAGFRRKNLPALLAKYFLDMREVLAGIHQLLKPGSPAYIVVGNNHTVARGHRVEIETAKLLAEIAVMVGLKEGNHIPMEMLPSREIFKHNAVASETILELIKPQ